MWSSLKTGLTGLRLPTDLPEESYVSWWTPSAIIKLAKHCPNLTEMTIQGYDGVTDATISVLATHYPNLSRIYIYGAGITDVAITALATHCPKLTDIYLGYCQNVSDASIIEIATHCPNLTMIDISLCDQVTDVAITALASHCPGLTTLNFMGCEKVSNVARKVLQLCLPNLDLPSNHDNVLSKQEIIERPELLADLTFCYCNTGLVPIRELLVEVYRPRFATLRIKRFWRDVCCNPVYRYARKRIHRLTESESG